MAATNVQVLLAKRPTGNVTEDSFEIVESGIPAPAEGEVLVEIRWLSLDPYMRGRMGDAKSYAAKVELGQPMIGGAVGVVVASRAPADGTEQGLREGDWVVGTLGWQAYAVAKPGALRKIDVARVPPQAYLGVLGMPGVTAWIGLHDFGAPKPGETVVVSAATGAVGGVVGQLAKLRGARAIGIAGGPEKCALAVRELGFDACVDHRAPDFEARLAEATPGGIDVDFENVGGPVMDAVFRRLNPFARVALCGLVSQYEQTAPYGVTSFQSLLVNRVRVQGFIVSDHLDRWPAALAGLGALVAEGKLRWRETVVDGLRAAPRALMGVLRGENLGKQLVRVKGDA
jgi:hypothetical protein